MNFELTTHVYKRLNERNIPVQVLMLVLEAPEQVLDEEDGKVYQSKVTINGKTRLLRTFVNDSVQPARVKSVYDTSKIEKYWSTE